MYSLAFHLSSIGVSPQQPRPTAYSVPWRRLTGHVIFTQIATTSTTSSCNVYYPICSKDRRGLSTNFCFRHLMCELNDGDADYELKDGDAAYIDYPARVSVRKPFLFGTSTYHTVNCKLHFWILFHFLFTVSVLRFHLKISLIWKRPYLVNCSKRFRILIGITCTVFSTHKYIQSIWQGLMPTLPGGQWRSRRKCATVTVVDTSFSFLVSSCCSWLLWCAPDATHICSGKDQRDGNVLCRLPKGSHSLYSYISAVRYFTQWTGLTVFGVVVTLIQCNFVTNLHKHK